MLLLLSLLTVSVVYALRQRDIVLLSVLFALAFSGLFEAVLNRRTYVLEKYHNPVAGERLEFDFSKCDGTVEDAIMALASVEKVFRFYKDPDVTPNDLVRVDKKIDAYLRKCFNRYDYYCSDRQEIGEESFLKFQEEQIFAFIGSVKLTI